LKEPNLLHEAAHGLLGAKSSNIQGDFRGVTTTETSIAKLFTISDEITRQTKTSPADVIQLSGCKNYQTSADATVGVNSHSFGLTERAKRRGL
jgi:metacaspase-1